MEKLKETTKSRKFWFTVGPIVAAILLFRSGAIDSEQSLAIVSIAAGVYVGALSVEDAAKRIFEAVRQHLE